MYGLLLEGIKTAIAKLHGQWAWDEIALRLNLPESFERFTVYPDDLIPRIGNVASSVLVLSAEEIMEEFGMEFVGYVNRNLSYDSILKVLGRHMTDFLNGLDNLHDHMRFTYPTMRAPSFFVENETHDGLTLHYRTMRGETYVHYVMGQIRAVGRELYGTEVSIRKIESSTIDTQPTPTTHVIFRVTFDNSAYSPPQTKADIIDENFVDDTVKNVPLRADVLFQLFPFHVVFGKDMLIRSVGTALDAVVASLVDKNLTDVFEQVRPLVDFTWDQILAHTNNVFELATIQCIRRDRQHNQEQQDTEGGHGAAGGTKTRLRLKGQMVMMEEWNAIMFLGTPVMNNLEDMFNAGLYLNDLSMHDCSRDLVLAGTQQSAELKMALDQEQIKGKLLRDSMKQLDLEIKRTDEFVYQLMPKPVADRLRRGESAVSTCQSFDNVTILFSDVVGFTTICSKISPMEVVSMLNAMYTVFDRLSEKHDVYKVETIGDAYMAVAGAPTVSKVHAESMSDMSLDMLAAMPHLKDPSSQDSMKIRIGIHTGSTVAGVVGLKMPRYCLFGDTVNTASRMESTGQAMQIHVSATTREKLKKVHGAVYMLVKRSPITIKGKGTMRTYWLEGRKGPSVHERKQPQSEPLAATSHPQPQQPSPPLEASPSPDVTSVASGRMAERATPEGGGAVGGQSERRVDKGPLTRKMYCPVSFDDLTNDRGAGRRGSERPSSGNAVTEGHRERAYTDRMVTSAHGGGREAAAAAGAGAGRRRVSSPNPKISGLQTRAGTDTTGGGGGEGGGVGGGGNFRCPFSGLATKFEGARPPGHPAGGGGGSSVHNKPTQTVQPTPCSASASSSSSPPREGAPVASVCGPSPAAETTQTQTPTKRGNSSSGDPNPERSRLYNHHNSNNNPPPTTRPQPPNKNNSSNDKDRRTNGNATRNNVNNIHTKSNRYTNNHKGISSTSNSVQHHPTTTTTTTTPTTTTSTDGPGFVESTHQHQQGVLSGSSSRVVNSKDSATHNTHNTDAQRHNSLGNGGLKRQRTEEHQPPPPPPQPSSSSSSSSSSARPSSSHQQSPAPAQPKSKSKTCVIL